MCRRLLAPIVLLALASALGTAGCTHVVTLHERHASFAVHADVRIGQEPARTFLLNRTAILMCGANISAEKDAQGHITRLNVPRTDQGKLGYGSAAAVDRRGYLLTAGHCVQEPMYLLFGGENGIARFEKATVIWRGDAAKKEPDVAVLRVDQSIDFTFEWTADFRRNDAVLGAGLDYDQPVNFAAGCIAGRITRIDRPLNGYPEHMVVFHDAPLHGGDSGGPLTTREGKLIGINTAAGSLRIWPFLLKVSIAERPSLAWLQTLIDADFTKRANVAPAPSAVSRQMD